MGLAENGRNLIGISSRAGSQQNLKGRDLRLMGGFSAERAAVSRERGGISAVCEGRGLASRAGSLAV